MPVTASSDSRLKIKVLLRGQNEVKKLWESLDGQTIAVGQDLVGIEVSNELVVARSLGPRRGTRR